MENLKLSNQAIGALMMSLQKCIMEQIDIVGLLKEFNLTIENNEVIVLNPPVVSVKEE